MNTLSWDELQGHGCLIDEAARDTDGVDQFCSSSAWVLPAAGALTPPTVAIAQEAEGALFVGGLARLGDGTEVLAPLEMAWGLSCPLLGRDAGAVAALTRRVVTHPTPWQVAIITGVDLGAPHGQAVADGMAAAGSVRLGGEPTVRWIASLEGGVDGYLARRSRNFRRALARGQRRAREVGVVFERIDATTAAGARAAYARALAVEAKTWKHADGVGLIGTAMERFYADMVVRLAQGGGHRQIMARLDGEDIGYILGGVFAGAYRGLQFGYATTARSLSLGGLMQMETIGQLCAEGVSRYDLGTDLDYKRRWAEIEFQTVALVVVRGR